MIRLLLKLWRRLFPLECGFCDFTSRYATVLGKHKKRCKVRLAVAAHAAEVRP